MARAPPRGGPVVVAGMAFALLAAVLLASAHGSPPAGAREAPAALVQSGAKAGQAGHSDAELLRRALRRMHSGSHLRASHRAAEEQAEHARAEAQRFRASAEASSRAENPLGAMGNLAFGRKFTTWTDVEMCEGCKALMENVVRSTSEASAVRDIMFAIHSACNNQPEVFMEACMHATHYDANLAILRQQGSNVESICSAGGMCIGESKGLIQGAMSKGLGALPGGMGGMLGI
ncbi:hypothetical protein FNF31_00404 [Cafeteria roenbergensis]|uniref:Saposin B-type domain-containing protein n=2 Tax=Cafeteria roenbergensis TaxID=33653 RepID=A0A5A8DV35_CAFRO|nr:hypothetical protein FNF31_00404 [Cafeteria roenbergensis]